MKKKLLLETVLKLKADVERSITSSYDDIFKYNFTEKQTDILLDRVAKFEIQLIIFKEVIQEANKSKYKGKTNNYNIYYLSNLKTTKFFYDKLLKTFSRKTKDVELAQITKEEATTTFKQLKEDIKQFENKLSAFNSTKKVTVILDEDLNLL